VSKYLTLAEEGLVSKVDCPLDQGLLMPNQDINDKIYLYCLSCDYKKEIGLDLYGRMEEAVRRN
jgi:DNA-directed RNA polymerase subunit M/transcription elongation factor TFIIS